MATSVAKNTGKYVAGAKARAANFMAKFGLRAKALGNTRGKGQTCIAGKSNSNTGSKALAKMWQGLKTGRVSGKSRWHIAWPKDIVCSRWLAQAASGIVSYAKQVNMFNQIVAVSNDQT